MKRPLLLLALAGVIGWATMPSATADPDLATRVAQLTLTVRDQTSVITTLRTQQEANQARLACLSGAVPVTQYTDGGKTFLDASRRARARHLWVVVWAPGCANDQLMRSAKNRAWSW